MASHCLEHTANPIRALKEWKRILVKNGLLLLVLPHKDGTFDWRRPVTTLKHMIWDYENNTAEDDLTHVSEELALRDLERQPAGSPEEFKQTLLTNKVYRCLHHHVFDTKTAVTLVDYIGLQLDYLATLQPYLIVILGRRSGRRIGNSRFLRPFAMFCTRSPFPSDHPRT